MSLIATLLAAKEPLFDHSLEQLEERTGRVGIDAALAAEIVSTAALKTVELGLDPDCSGPELYAALLERIRLQNQHLAERLGGRDEASVPEMLPLIEQAALSADIPRRGFFIKREVAADMLRRQPPPGVMGRLGYHDVDTMLRQEDLEEVYLALRFAETPEWLVGFNRRYHSLTAADFENRNIRLIAYEPKKWGDIAAGFISQKFHNITNSKEIGAIAIMPLLVERMPGILLKDLPLIFHYYNEIRLYSAFFKLMQTKRNFGEIVATTLIAEPASVSVLHGQQIHWRVIQRYFGKHPEGHPEIFQPHVQPEDLHWRKAEAVLYELDPELGFWRDLDFVAVLKGNDIISFNPLDVSFSYSNRLSYADRYIYHFRESLWNEVFARYMGQKVLEEQILVRLDNDLIAPEELKVKED